MSARAARTTRARRDGPSCGRARSTRATPSCADDGGRHDPAHRRAHRGVQDEQRDHGQHHEHDLAGRPLPGDGAQAATDVPRVQAVPHTAMDVADHARRAARC